MNMKNSKGFKKSNKQDFKSKIIQKQADEIDGLKHEVSRLKNLCDEKDEIINSVDSYRCELQSIVLDLRSKQDEYNKKIEEIKKMKKVFDEELYKGRWDFVKLFIG